MTVGICDVVKVNVNGQSPICGSPPITPPPPIPDTWIAADLETSENLLGVASDSAALIIVVGANGFASRSQDAGTTWETLAQGIGMPVITDSLHTVGVSDEGTIIVGGENGAVRSDDGGDTWAEIPIENWTGETSFRVCDTNGEGHWVLASVLSSDTYYSDDDGLTWTLNDTTPGSSGNAFQGGQFIRGTLNTFLLAANNGLGYSSIDGGVTWTRFFPQGLATGDTNSNFRDIASINNTYIMQNSGDVPNSRSTDGGINWSALPAFFNSGNAGVQQFGAIASDARRVFVSVQENGYAAMSTDRGMTWNPLTRGLNSNDIGAEWNGIATNRNGVWVAVADDGHTVLGTASE